MKAKVMGFKWELNNNSKNWTSDLYNAIDANFKYSTSELQKMIENQTDVEETSFEKIMGVKKHGHFWNGFLIGIKDRSSILKIINNNGSLILGSQNLNKNEKLVDVNFFVFDEKKLKGLYIYYHQSNWIDKFNEFIRSTYNELNNKKIKEEENKLNRKFTDLEKAKFRKALPKLATTIHTSHDSFETILANMKEIGKVSLSWTYDEIVKQDFVPLSKVSKAANTHFTFDKYARVKSIISRIKESIPFAKEMSVYGKSENNGSISDVVAKLTKNYKYFAEKEFSSLYEKLNIDILNLDATLQNHDKIFRWLEDIANKNL